MAPQKNNSNGKWQLAFWIMSTVIVGTMIILTNNVIANDRRNVDDHKEIRSEMSDKFDKLFDEVKKISERTVRIETKVGSSDVRTP